MSSAANKIAAIVRCVHRARAEYTLAGDSFKGNFTHQDAAVLNILRGCEAAVDLANMLVRKKRLGLPGEMKDSFALLDRGGFIPPSLSRQMQNMVGFRNIAVHQYRDLDIDVVEDIIRNRLDDLLLYAETVRTHLADDQ